MLCDRYSLIGLRKRHYIVYIMVCWKIDFPFSVYTVNFDIVYMPSDMVAEINGKQIQV